MTFTCIACGGQALRGLYCGPCARLRRPAPQIADPPTPRPLDHLESVTATVNRIRARMENIGDPRAYTVQVPGVRP